MSVANKDPAAAIKLFGKTIALPPRDDDENTSSAEEVWGSQEEEEEGGEGKETPPCDKRKAPGVGARLPCPRCKSRVTKFCYYNNYNVNQPRHFCKNCQRYWTAGGTTRNVPVGSGRRKNKTSSSSSSSSYFLRRIMFSPDHHHPNIHAAASSPFYGAVFGRPRWLSAPISPAAALGTNYCTIMDTDN
ncbi:unnamed protein product [Cuscuta campestris]|uniref:Dof-type domain-containing protein n=1 Tax=Cuscuta campestris TaxID=132261 RepID=A0A484L805_9ASTE|nr:unnamed protein product [Cuscuta campestris]